MEVIQKPSEPSTPRMTIEDLVLLLTIGVKFCIDHPPMPNEFADGGKAWSVCLATLPTKTGIELQRELTMVALGQSDVTTLRENAPACRPISVEPTEKADTFFKELQGKPASPDSFLLPVTRAFVRLDIAKYSQFPVALQPLVLADVQESVQVILRDKDVATPVPEFVIHTGDGFILVFQWNPKEDNAWLLATAARIAGKLDRKNDNPERLQVHFRMSVTLGLVYLTRDLAGRVNYAGEAITETERLISCMPSNLDDLVYFSENVYRNSRSFISGMQKFSRLGSGADKHGAHRRLYSLEYMEYGFESKPDGP
jgi:class 3 adenylate cyclase